MWQLWWVGLLAGLLGAAATGAAPPREVTLAERGLAQATIYAALPPVAAPTEARDQPGRAMVRATVQDLALYLGRIAGAQFDVVYGEPPAGAKTLPILVGELATQRFGPPAVTSPYKQAYRVAVTPQAIGLLGESDEAVSYAVYEVLDRLGCRWYLPGEMGDVWPRRESLRLPAGDESRVPPMLYRNLWYADGDYKRRNRLGGVVVEGRHGLEGYITADQRKEHPDWNAEFGGKRAPAGRLCWGNPEVAAAVAAAIIAQLDAQYRPSVTLSPGDGMDFCDCAKCRALDADDRDPSMNCISLSDRLIHFCNQVVERVVQKHPNVLFGLYAYVQYTRPPVREKPHPNLVICLAPITYCRAHSMLHPDCPSRQALRPIVEGWGKVATRLAFRGYVFNLGEVNAPYPMLSLWSDEFPVCYRNQVRFWMPESMTTFENSLPGLYLNVRLPWFPEADPKAVLAEFYTGFYGAAAAPMARYWQTMDAAWTETPEHAGNVFGYLRRFPKERLAAARAAVNEALAACQTAMEYRRVKFTDDSLRQFELFMRLRVDLAEGRLAALGPNANRFLVRLEDLRGQYAREFAFGQYQGDYFRRFFGGTYDEGSRLAREFKLVGAPLRPWRYQVDREARGEALGWGSADLADKEWPTTDPCVDTWAALGLAEFYGTVWYRTSVKLPAVPAGKKVYLWVTCLDSACKLFVNGQHVPYVNAKGERVAAFSGYCVPASYDLTAAIKPGAENQITIAGSRPPGWINELGTGGLMGPVLIYMDK